MNFDLCARYEEGCLAYWEGITGDCDKCSSSSPWKWSSEFEWTTDPGSLFHSGMDRWAKANLSMFPLGWYVWRVELWFLRVHEVHNKIFFRFKFASCIHCIRFIKGKLQCNKAHFCLVKKIVNLIFMSHIWNCEMAWRAPHLHSMWSILCIDHIRHLVCYFLVPHTHVLCMGSGSATGKKIQVRLVHSLLKYFFLFQLWYWIKNLHYQIFKFVIDNSDISLNCLQHIQKRRNFDAKVTCHQPICLLLHAILSGVGVGARSATVTSSWQREIQYMGLRCNFLPFYT